MKSGLVLVVLGILLLLAVPVKAQNDVDITTRCVQGIELQYTLGAYGEINDYIDLPVGKFEGYEPYYDYNRLEWAALIAFHIRFVAVEAVMPDDYFQENETLTLKIFGSSYNRSGWSNDNVSEGDYFGIDGHLNVTSGHVFVDGNVDDDILVFNRMDFQISRRLNLSERSASLEITLVISQVWELRWHSWEWVCGGVVEPDPVDDLLTIVEGLAPIGNIMFLAFCAIYGTATISSRKKTREFNRIRNNLTLPYSRFVSE